MVSFGQECMGCGRIGPHCPVCGVVNYYHVVGLDVGIKIAGVETQLKGFRCRKCGAQFREDVVCTAPASKAVAKKQNDESASAYAKKNPEKVKSALPGVMAALAQRAARLGIEPPVIKLGGSGSSKHTEEFDEEAEMKWLREQKSLGR